MDFGMLRVILLLVLAYAFYSIVVQLILGEHHLIAMKGSLLKKESAVKTDTLSNGEIKEYANLWFTLNETRRIYLLEAEITGIDQGFNVFGGVDLELGYAGEITVMISESEFEKFSPKVYTIYADGKNIFELQRKPANIQTLYLLATLFMIGFMIVMGMRSDVFLRSKNLIQKKARVLN